MMETLRQAETDEPLPRQQQQEDDGPPARGLTGLQSMLDAQRDRIHQQLQELQRVVLLQCRITGTNPLAQEMAAAVLGKRTGKRSGESLTPRALKCLYNVFSIKDTITKKEAREISALSGATVTQVREFFTGQRSRVRKVVQISHGEAMSGNLCLGVQSLKMDPSTNGLHNGDDMETLPPQTVDSQSAYHSLLNVLNSKADGGSSKLNAVEKAEHLINVMRKENTFTGQSQLAQSILQAHGNILHCFMARGGLQQIIKWLIQAAVEEQTSLIRLILKTITQLPLGSALPRQMSSLLQTVNKLRFYRAQDVASRARLLLSRWSRFFRSAQNGKMPSSTGLVRTSQHAQKRIRDTTSSHKDEDASKKKPKTGIMVDCCGQLSDLVSSSLTTDKAMHPSGESEITMEINSMRKQLGSSFIQGDCIKGKRKVQLFEEARAAVRRKNAETAKSSTYESAPRPLSADDIKKAKRRAFFLNSANAQKPSSSRSNKPSMLESSAVCSFARQSSVPFLQEGRFWRRTMKDAGNNIGISDVGNRPENALEMTPLSTVLNDPEGLHEKLEQDVSSREVMIREPSNVLNTCVESVKIEGMAGSQGYLGLDFKPSKLSDDVRQTERCRGADSMDFAIIQWATPPRISLDPRWRVASGEQSTETGFQSVRLSNEQAALYPSPECIPPNPEEPAERVSLFVDDTLVPEIILEALDEESHDRDGSLQSPRYLESARARGQETDSKKLNTGADVSGQGVSSFGEKGCDRRLSVELDMAIKHTDSLEPSNENKLESSLLFVSKGFDQSKPMNELNGTLDTIKILCANPSELKFATPLDQSLEVGTELPKTGLCIPLSQLKRKENVLEHREQTVVGSCLALKDPEAEALADALGRKDMVTPFQKVFGIAKDPSPDNLQFPLLLDHSLNASADKKTSGWNLSELSKEACLDLLKIVLQQLSDNGKGSGPDLELLSVFLKNPELVFALMATQDGSLGKDLASGASAGNDSNANNASSILKDLVIQVEKLVGRNVLNVVDDARENEREGTPTSLPSLHVIIPPISRPIAAATPQLRLSLPTMPPPLPQLLPVIDQEVQPHNCHSKVVGSTQFSQQTSPQADTSRLYEDLALENSGYDWSRSYDHPHSYSQEDARSARPSTQTPVPTRPSVGRCSSLSEYPPSQPGSIQLPMTRAYQPPNRRPTIQTDLVRSSMFRYGGGHGQLNPSAFHVERQERAKNRKNGFSFADVPNAPLLRNVQSRDSGISAGILPVPEVAHTNHRVQPSKMMQGAHIRQIEKVPVFMPDVRVGSIPHPVMGNRMPAHLNYGRFCHDQNFRPLQPSSSCLHSLHSPLPHARSPPSFVHNSLRPQGNTMMWKPPLSNSDHRRHTRPGWREG